MCSCRRRCQPCVRAYNAHRRLVRVVASSRRPFSPTVMRGTRRRTSLHSLFLQAEGSLQAQQLDWIRRQLKMILSATGNRAKNSILCEFVSSQRNDLPLRVSCIDTDGGPFSSLFRSRVLVPASAYAYTAACTLWVSAASPICAPSLLPHVTRL